MNTSGPRRAIVVGGGLGGLTAALSLRQAGFEPVVLERQERRERIEAGAGLFIWHNAVRALQRVGVADAVLAVSSPPVERFEMRSWRGKPIMSFATGDVSRKMGSATVGVTRPALHAALSTALEPGVLRLGQTCVGFEQDGSGVTVRLGDGGEERADLLVGADGMDSTVREQLLGPTRRRYAGYTSWRGSLDFDREVVPVGTFTKFWGRGARLLYYHIGGGKLYWLALPQAPEGGRDGEGKRRSNVLGHYRGWVDPVEAVLEATDESAIHREDIYDRDPLKQWGKGRVTLLGDAAHPMTPNLGQGACQAIEDAVVLGTRLGAEVDVPTALRAFEAQRRPRTTSFQRRSRLIGAAGLLRSRAACATRDALLRLVFAERSPILRRDTRAELELEL